MLACLQKGTGKPKYPTQEIPGSQTTVGMPGAEHPPCPLMAVRSHRRKGMGEACGLVGQGF